ncbi:MAG: ribonuclease H-like domain-containing protein [Chitinophagaceae bacterium]|nr:ribonuclease H-like domain-containing protein [Chitinophagaceae bacterium]
MIYNANLNHLLILDIETVPQYSDFSQLPDHWKELWLHKMTKTMPENFLQEEWYSQRAGIQSEFGKIICISTGLFHYDSNGKLVFKLKSLYGNNEAALLKSFNGLLHSFKEKRSTMLIAGHNIKEFDIPFICRRMMINQIVLPDYLQLSSKKPWETNLVDTMELWKFGDYKNYTSLHLLATVLGIETPKDDIDGSMVKDVYYKENDLPRIVTYCQKDVVTVANILMRFKNLPLLEKEQISVV